MESTYPSIITDHEWSNPKLKAMAEHVIEMLRALHSGRSLLPALQSAQKLELVPQPTP